MDRSRLPITWAACDEKCLNAAGGACDCACGGKNHGKLYRSRGYKFIIDSWVKDRRTGRLGLVLNVALRSRDRWYLVSFIENRGGVRWWHEDDLALPG